MKLRDSEVTSTHLQICREMQKDILDSLWISLNPLCLPKRNSLFLSPSFERIRSFLPKKKNSRCAIPWSVKSTKDPFTALESICICLSCDLILNVCQSKHKAECALHCDCGRTPPASKFKSSFSLSVFFSNPSLGGGGGRM